MIEIHFPLIISVLLSLAAYALVNLTIPLISEKLISKTFFGKDLLKKNRPIIPESMGTLVGAIYFGCLFVFIPVPFVDYFKELGNGNPSIFPHHQLASFLSSLLSLLCMFFLGFADDALDLRWRVKIWFPLFASLPLLMVYHASLGETTIVLPPFLRTYFGSKLFDLGFFYYLYMAALCIFSTNAINILAGVNGIEASQALMISSSILVNNFYQVFSSPLQTTKDAHLFSIYFLLPFVGATLGYLKYNWFPAKCFGGDTFAYFAGMIIAVVAIQGHFSKMVLLLMIPQVFNFVYSAPQLFGFIDCPRHRMPKSSLSYIQLNESTLKIEPSIASLDKIKPFGMMIVHLLNSFGIVKINRDKNTGKPISINNLTLVNLILVKMGPMREDKIVMYVIAIHVVCSALAFFIRYYIPFIWY